MLVGEPKVSTVLGCFFLTVVAGVLKRSFDEDDGGVVDGRTVFEMGVATFIALLLREYSDGLATY